MSGLPFPDIDPVAIEIGPLQIRWYALAYLAGLLLGWWLARRIVRRPGWRITAEQLDDLLFYATLGIIIGGRLGYVIFYNPGYYLRNPVEILFLWEGGMSFHGGLVGVLVAVWWCARKHRLSLFEVGDVVAAVAPIGLLLGRIANFINGELWGRPTDLPWAVVFPHAGPEPRHPSQLYEAALEGLLLLLVLQYLAHRPRSRIGEGTLAGVFLLGYGLARIFVEFFREPDPQLGFLFGVITMGQLLSIPLVLAGIWLLLRARQRPLAA